MVLMRRDLSTIFDDEAQVQRIVFRIAQPEQYTARLEALTDCSKHFCSELLGRRFGSQDIEAAHHHFDVTACELLRSAQSLLCTVAFNRDPRQMCDLCDDLLITKSRTPRL